MSKYVDSSGLTYFYQKIKTLFAPKSQQQHVIAGRTLNETTAAMNLSSVDLNDVVTSGFYNAIGCTHAAYQKACLIVMGYYGTGYCTQIISDMTSGELSTRTKMNGTWTDWAVLSTQRYVLTHDGDQTVTMSEFGTFTDASAQSY